MIASQVPMYSPPSLGQWRAAGKSRMSTLSSRRWFSFTGEPSPSTSTGGIGLANLVLHRWISSITGSPAGSPMARANRSTLEPRGVQSERKPLGDPVVRAKRRAGAPITYMAPQELGAPALLFERIKGSPKGFRSLWNPLGSSVDRFALAIGEPAGLPVMELIHRCKTKFANPIPPVDVEGEGSPVNENHLRDDKVDIRDFPAARHWPRDGGEYIGTCDAIITRDPDGGWLNVGCYRQMVQGKDQVGLYLSPGKDARLHIERYWSRNEPCEVVCCWGIDPALFIAASQTFPKTTSELDFFGGILGGPSSW